MDAGIASILYDTWMICGYSRSSNPTRNNDQRMSAVDAWFRHPGCVPLPQHLALTPASPALIPPATKQAERNIYSFLRQKC